MKARPPSKETRLQRARCDKDLTQTAVAARVGLTQSGYSKIERGLITPDVMTAQKIADAVGVAVAELWPAVAAEVSR